MGVIINENTKCTRCNKNNDIWLVFMPTDECLCVDCGNKEASIILNSIPMET